jgi:2,2-dialkylglycine decarboxylase (pyruvate)
MGPPPLPLCAAERTFDPRECLDLGMMTSVVRSGLSIFRIAPPITIEAREIDLGLAIFDRALARAVH